MRHKIIISISLWIVINILIYLFATWFIGINIVSDNISEIVHIITIVAVYILSLFIKFLIALYIWSTIKWENIKKSIKSKK